MANRFYMPIKGETIQQHFDNNGWPSIQAQIDAGYNYFLQPCAISARVEMVKDFVVLASSSTLITLSFSKVDIAGSVTLTPTLMTSADNTTWTTHTVGATRVYANNFRYVKIRLDALGADDLSFCRIQDVRVFLTTKEETISGMATTDGSGQVTVDITGQFIGVSGISHSAEYNPSYPVDINYEFADVPNPTSITFHSFRGDTGAVVGGASFSYIIKGVRA